MSRHLRLWTVGVLVLTVGFAAGWLCSGSAQESPRPEGRARATRGHAVAAVRTIADESQGESSAPRTTRPGRIKSLPELKDLRLKDADDIAEEHIEQALAAPTDFDFDEEPLEEVVQYFKDYHQIPIWLDRAAIQEEMSLNQTVTAKVAGIHFESALHLLLDPLKLDWLIEDEVLKITTRDKASASAETLTFDVQNLIDAGHEPEELLTAIVDCVEPRSWQGNGGEGTIAHSGGVLICRQSQRVQSRVALLLGDLDGLAEKQLEDADQSKPGPLVTLKAYHTYEYPAEELALVARKMIAPDSWDHQGTSMNWVKGAIFVKQTPHVHREIAKLLKQLLAPADPAIVPDAALAPAGGGLFHVEGRSAPDRVPSLLSAFRFEKKQ